MATDINQIKAMAVPVLKSAGVIRSSLFGSAARGEMDENSDIDFLIEFPRGKTLLDLVDLQNQLEANLNSKIDLVTFKSIHPLLRDQILKEQVQIL
ncbi:nucleotidyltransferase family protein [Candidatus Gottesmanbacteria bacterium]|nr:nucleotidyltransferase family protein [Candidatus Gottesmanbacteria bacterium]